MYIIEITYKKPIEEVEKHLVEHRAYLDKFYQNGMLIMSGPKNPRDGGVIIANQVERSEIENLIKNDPYNIHDIADYKLIEFDPVKNNINNFKTSVNAIT